ncbi:RIB72 protein, putative [Trichomonas vaginalis G3]|uniref:RIB72 protein, putative n=1 Tax=Trichomonas vaginalis (strain ATCC PRA-98 / G3) TaxID=412133 RepID=A2DHM4_TRIV3|nr:EF-Hand domain C-terminal containing protein family [Trichomonas vaginalis G3]EAY20072.1 RIB72 protein, putative [Trichomonas vaginalis G3]KAI5528025.1 EF-Hand domain C-terminal containing protein family [Trichomonas vaginalis G3]|eukprot:XP_001581058.1 RIB72 protein [Trichomonas vaginalis G3]
MNSDKPYNELRFLAKMISKNPDNDKREFSVIFSLVNDEVKVWENKTDGFDGGFVYKAPHIRPKAPPHYNDMYIGANVEINHVVYKLYGAPENTYEIMEAYSDDFPRSDLTVIIPKLKPIKSKLQEDMMQKLIPDTDRIKLTDAENILQHCGVELCEQEIISIIRRYRFFMTKTFSVQEFINSI